MKQTLIISQIILSLLLIVLILIQARGTGISRSWTASASAFTRRGLEKILFKGTFVIALLFITVSILQLVF